jgi:hypothetical protein
VHAVAAMRVETMSRVQVLYRYASIAISRPIPPGMTSPCGFQALSGEQQVAISAVQEGIEEGSRGLPPLTFSVELLWLLNGFGSDEAVFGISEVGRGEAYLRHADDKWNVSL